MPADPMDDFVARLVESGLMTADDVRACQATLPAEVPSDDPATLARHLVERKKLTTFQASSLVRGEARHLVLGNYVILDAIGRGGMGEVFKAEHRMMERVVALKVLPGSSTMQEESVRRFLREVKAAAKLNHPNIVAAYDADRANGVYFLVMEYVEADNLSNIVKDGGPLSVDGAIDAVAQAALGLEYAHSRGVVHRDIKPSNLLCDREGRVKVLDMGLARIAGPVGDDVLAQAELTQTGVPMGTIDFMSPEQADSSRHADQRADIYSLGCTLHYLLAGTSPYSGKTSMARLLAHREQPIPSLRDVRGDVPKKVNAVFRRMVAKRAEERFQTMTEVIDALRSCGAACLEPGRQPPNRTASDTAQRFFAHARAEADRMTAPTMTEPSTIFHDEEVREEEIPPPRPRRMGWVVVGVLAVAGLMGGLFASGTVTGTHHRDTETRRKEEKTVEPAVVARAATSGPVDPSPIPADPPPKPEAKPAAPPATGADPERDAAVWALEIGGRVVVLGDTLNRQAKAVGDLPSTRFQVINVDLHDNGRVDDSSLAHLEGLSHLEELNLYGTATSDEGLQHLNRLTMLSNLNIARTRVTGAGLVHLQGMVKLVYLNLEGLEITDSAIEHVKALSKLIHLDLSGTNISDAGVHGLAALDDLLELSLNETIVGDLGIKSLKDLPNLTDLQVRKTRVTDEGVAAFKVARPNCEVSR